jgi:diacylglycerol kinase (ATP)
MNKPGKTGLVRLYYATLYSIKGFKAAWSSEEAFRIEVCLCMLFIPAAFIVGENLSHKLILFIACVLVLITEVINTAIESVVDRISLESHPLSGQAKDLGSLMVLMAMIFFLAVWAISLWQYVLPSAPN